MSYSGINSELRTNESFRSKKDEDYHKGTSPLEMFPDLNITDAVLLEYMHCVCLGVMKRLLIFWKKGKKTTHFINDDIANEISSDLIRLKSFYPKEFSRLPRSLEELKFWKATEFRSFLLYSGLIVLRGKLKKSLYKHFMLLHCSVRLLMSDETCITYNELANKMLRQFVTQYSDLYGEEYITYNVHGLIHLAQFVKMHGSLDKFSAFKFENCLQIIKSTLKNCRFPLQDVYNRLIEYKNIDVASFVNYPILKKEITYDPLLYCDPTDTLYEAIVLEKWIISTVNNKNMYFMLKNKNIICIKKIVRKAIGNIILEVVKFNSWQCLMNHLILV
ncbi:uncharacterized protein LOC126553503 [Aphis gossypii]|uniref:uncharacterized protein LOC126553503 n=1 Tax=Aphis gossypii TaxID=80765 RepID=UPI002158C6C0|nr:uncharacterized protein LOC126553503 [Aphis gossypii]